MSGMAAEYYHSIQCRWQMVIWHFQSRLNVCGAPAVCMHFLLNQEPEMYVMSLQFISKKCHQPPATSMEFLLSFFNHETTISSHFFPYHFLSSFLFVIHDIFLLRCVRLFVLCAACLFLVFGPGRVGWWCPGCIGKFWSGSVLCGPDAMQTRQAFEHLSPLQNSELQDLLLFKGK